MCDEQATDIAELSSLSILYSDQHHNVISIEDDGASVPEKTTVHNLASGWQFKQTDTEEWMPVRHVPTEVHIDLMDNKKIVDPFIGYDELKCQWVAQKSWTYRTTLPLLTATVNCQTHKLVFDGLDTFATVKLNGKVILKSDNMFIPHRVDVTKQLLEKTENVLEIEFASALLQARKIKDAHPEHKWVGFNGDMSRLAVRKAQYHWGWDWGPILMTCGPWRPVRLETYHTRISDLRVDYSVADDLHTVNGRITASIEGHFDAMVRISIALTDRVLFEHDVPVNSDGTATTDFEIDEVNLWYPHGYGDQPLYEVTATICSREQSLHTTSRKTGFRKAELIQDFDDIGRSFYFRINGVDVFCGGSDWIPADSFTTRITADRYKKWLQTLVDGNQVMIRIWGGGIWEADIFYETCDELGILVWQDFMFGCGNYPAYPEMRTSVEKEAVAQLKRLRHHPSIVIYAGNNEDYQVQEQCGLTYDYKDKDPENWLRTDFPARYIYEKILPEAIASQSPHTPYHPGSPWSHGNPTSDQTTGDMHQWNVWHGTQEKYQIYASLGGRFNSEFGLEAFPHIETIKHFITDPKTQLYPQSRMLDFHNKAAGHERRIATYLVENFRMPTMRGRDGLETWIHLTQLSQAEALTYGYRGWRRQWGQQRRCGGALVWQLNDCWPVTSWSIVDYFLRKKPGYYTMRRALAPIAVAVERAHHDWSVAHARPAPTSALSCWVASSKTRDVSATVEIRFVSIATGEDIKGNVVRRDIKVLANGTTDVVHGIIDNETEEPHVLAARIWIGGEIVSRDMDWPQPYKYLEFGDRGVSVSQRGDKMAVKCDKPTKGLVFEEREGVLIDDSAIDLVPGDEQIITVKGLKDGDEPLKWRYYEQQDVAREEHQTSPRMSQERST